MSPQYLPAFAGSLISLINQPTILLSISMPKQHADKQYILLYIVEITSRNVYNFIARHRNRMF